MKKWNYCWERVALATLSLFICVSCSAAKPHWEYATSTRAECIYYATDDNYRGIDLEVMHSRSGDRMYASVHSAPIRSENVKVEVVSNDLSAEYEAYKFEGGQRFLLPQEAIDTIFALLQQRKPVTLQIGRYEQAVTAEAFNKVYSKFRRNG